MRANNVQINLANNLISNLVQEFDHRIRMVATVTNSITMLFSGTIN